MRPWRCNAVSVAVAAAVPASRRFGRFSPADVALGHGADPFGLAPHVAWHRNWFREALRSLETGNDSFRRHAFVLFPSTPFVRSNVFARGNGADDHPAFAGANDIAGTEVFMVTSGVDYTLRDPPPNATRGDAAALAYLRLPPTTDGAVHLRANYVAALRAALQRLCDAQRTDGSHRLQSHTQTSLADDVRLHLPVTSIAAFGRAATRVFTSAKVFEAVTRDGVDPEVHDLARRLRLACHDADGMGDTTRSPRW